MIDVKLDHDDRTDLHDRVAVEIRRSIADGDAFCRVIQELIDMIVALPWRRMRLA